MSKPRPTRHAHQAQPKEIEKWFQDAFQRHEQGDMAGAEALYRRILASQPNHSRALYLLGTLESQRGNHSAAEGHLTKALALHSDWPEALNNLGLAMCALGRMNEAEPMFRRALALRPDYPNALNNLAGVLDDRGQAEEAVALYQRALELKPDYADAHHNLGLMLKQLHRLEEAVRYFERAVAINPNHFEACNNLAVVLKILDRLEEAEHWLRRALVLQPDFYDAHNNLAAVLQSQDRLEEAMEEYGQALRLRPDDALVQWNRAFILLALGNLKEGWEAYEWRRPVFHWQVLPFPEWDGGPLTGKTLLVFAEQGLGDELLFASCFPDLLMQAGHCLFECDPRLAPIYRRSFPGATVIGVKRTDRSWIQSLPPIDVQIPAGSLTRHLRPTPSSFPTRPSYLVADPAARTHWRERLTTLQPGLQVGITWRSGMMGEGRHRHYSRLNEWGAIFAIPGIHFISLQYDDCTEELMAVRNLFGAEVRVFPELDLFRDLEGAAALTSALDLVIAAGNAAGEIAAALGVPVWRLESHGRPWTSLGTDAFPWHPQMRVFRQAVRGEWGEVLERVAASLIGFQSKSPSVSPLSQQKTRIQDPHQAAISLIETGNRAWAADRLQEAEDSYRRALALDPNSPEAHNNLGSVLFDNSRFQDAERSYRAALALHADFPEAHYNLANVLHRQGQREAALVEYRTALSLRPDYAEAHNNLGRTLQEMDRLTEAEEALNRALALAPNLPEAHHNLGSLRHLQDRLEEALSCYRHALALHPTFTLALYNLANVLRELGRVEEALPVARRAVEQAPRDAKAAIILGDVLQDLNRFEEALPHYQHALEIHADDATETDPADAEARRNRAFCLLAAGDLTTGWAAYTARRSLLKPLSLAYPEWSGFAQTGNDSLTGKTILVLPEQGLGDELLFASCLPDLIAAAGHCVIECDPRLVSLYTRSFPTTTVLPAGALPSPSKEKIPDFQVRIGDLPRYLRPTLDRFPAVRGYLIPNPTRVTAWRERLAILGAGLKVGVTWRSGFLKTARRRHYTELSEWAPILTLPGIVFVNLQYDDCVAELATAREQFGVAIHTFPGLNLKDDLDEVAALSAALDLVIGTGNAATELAATLGVLVWRLESYGRTWTSLGTTVMPWHPAVRLFKQPRWGDWRPVFAALAAQLAGFHETEQPSLPASQDEFQNHLYQNTLPFHSPPLPPGDLTTARDHLRAGRLSQARECCRSYLVLHPEDPVALDLLGVAAHADGASEEALTAFHRAVTIAPLVALYQGHLANALATQPGHSNEAEVAYRAALALEPRWAEAHADLGNLLRASGRGAEAERCYLTALRHKPDLVEAHNNLGTLLEQQGRPAEAEAAYRGTLRLRPHFPEGWYNLGNCLTDLGRWTEAEAAYREALALRPDYAQAQFYLGVALAHLGQPAAAEAAYRQALVLRPTWIEALNALANLITERGCWSEAESLYREALSTTPTSHELYSNLGNCLQAQGRSTEAEAAYREALRLAPRFAPAWNNLGNTLRAQGRLAGGLAAFQEALLCDPDFPDAHSNLANALRETGALVDAEAHDRQAVALEPGLAGAWVNLGNTLLQSTSRLKEAEDCFRRALTLGWEAAVVHLGKALYEQGQLDAAIECLAEGMNRHPNDPELRWNLALPLLAQGNLEMGWAAYEWGCYLSKDQGRWRNLRLPFPEWDGSPLAGRTILVYAEQGVGDEVLFASCLPDLLAQTGHAIVECDRRLASLYTRSFPNATVIGTARDDHHWTADIGPVDVHIPVGSLPHFLRKSFADFPDFSSTSGAYLIPDPVQVAAWRTRLSGPGLKVGITWRSRLTGGARTRHYSLLKDWGALFAVPGVHFINLQYDDCVAELAFVREHFGVEVMVFPELDLMNDLDGVAALSASLDLVIAAGNAAGEVAAAVGVPVWRLEPFGRPWTSLGTESFPWHPQIRIFRQSNPGDWAEVLGRVAEALTQESAKARSLRLHDGSQLTPRLLLEQGRAHQTRDELDKAAVYCREALLLDPDNAEAHNDLGNVYLKQGDLAAADACYRQALHLRPDYVEAWNNLGTLLGKQKFIAEAITCYQTALDLYPELFEARYNLASLLQDEGDPAAAEDHFRQALHQGVDNALLWNGLALAVRDQGRMDEALSCFAEAQRCAPDDARIRWNVGLTYLAQGDLVRGWEGFEWGYRTMGRSSRGFEFPEWDGSALPEGTLLVYAEQGVGDEVLFASCLPDLFRWVGRCVIECEPRLSTLFTRSFPQAEIHGVMREDREWLARVGPIDFQCPIGSLGYYLRRHIGSFPRRPGYLLPDPAQRIAWRQRLVERGAGLKVGISWRSRLTSRGRARFYSRLMQWDALFAVPGVIFVNLQYDDCTTELAEVRTNFGVEVVQFPELDLLNDLDGVAALAGALDLVIAPPNAVAELAAAVGTEVWRLDAALPNWLTFGTDFMPWHPTMRLFRQEQLGDWEVVLTTVAETLAKRAMGTALNRWIEAPPTSLFPAQESKEAKGKIGQFLAQLMKPGAVAIQIGSGDELITLALAQAVGETGLVVVCEERPGPFRRLQAEVSHYGLSWVQCRPEQIGDHLGEFPAWRACPWDLLVSNDAASDLHWATASVPCRTVDNLDLPACDLLIIDAEGREIEILAGAWQTLTRFRPLLSLGRYRHDASTALIALLETRGYQSLTQDLGEGEVLLLAYPMV
ncbi:protein O-GlcNAc transferase [Gammaproteobacteria bacterium]